MSSQPFIPPNHFKSDSPHANVPDNLQLPPQSFNIDPDSTFLATAPGSDIPNPPKRPSRLRLGGLVKGLKRAMDKTPTSDDTSYTSISSPPYGSDYAKMSSPPSSAPSMQTYAHRAIQFLKTVHDLPWVSTERVTVDYYPGQRTSEGQRPVIEWQPRGEKGSVGSTESGSTTTMTSPRGDRNDLTVDPFPIFLSEVEYEYIPIAPDLTPYYYPAEQPVPMPIPEFDVAAYSPRTVDEEL